MPSDRVSFPIFDFSGGINTADEPVALQENEVVDIENFHLLSKGGLDKRRGYVVYRLSQKDDFVSFADQFNRVDDPNVGADWLEIAGDWDIFSNSLRHTATGVATTYPGYPRVGLPSDKTSGGFDNTISYDLYPVWNSTSQGGGAFLYNPKTDTGYVVSLIFSSGYQIRIDEVIRGELQKRIVEEAGQPTFSPAASDGIRITATIALGAEPLQVTLQIIGEHINSGGTVLASIFDVTLQDPRFLGGGFGIRPFALGVDERWDALSLTTSGTAAAKPITGIAALHQAGLAGTETVRVYELVVEEGEVTVRLLKGVDPNGTSAISSWVKPVANFFLSPDPRDIFRFIQLKDTLIGVNGVDEPIKWAGSLTADVEVIDTNIRVLATGNPTGDRIASASAIEAHENSIILGNVVLWNNTDQVFTKLESRLWPSEPGTLDSFLQPVDESGVIDVDDGDGGEIVGVHSALGYLVVLKTTGVYRIENFGVSGAQFVRKVANIGCAGRRASFLRGTFIFFIDVDGQLWAYDVRGENADSLLNLTLSKLGKTTLDTWVTERMPYAHIHQDIKKREIRVWLTYNGSDTTWPAVGTPRTNQGWVLNEVLQAWVKFRHVHPFNIIENVRDQNNELISLAGTYIGKVYKLDTGSADGENDAVPAPFVQTKPYHVNAADLIKGWRSLDVYTAVNATQPLTVEMLLDFETTGTTKIITLEPKE